MSRSLETLAAWLLGLLWIAPLVYALWAAVHPSMYATQFDLLAPLTFENFTAAWAAAPFGRYFLNTFLLVTSVLAAQLVLCTLAGFAFARTSFPGSGLLFALVDTILAIGLPYMASAFGIFLLRQTFKQVPKELDDAARVEGCGTFRILMRVYVPLARPTYLAYGLTSVSFHWNNFLWPLVITNTVETRPLTVGLSVFASTDQGIDWSIISAATLMTSAPLLLGFLLFQRQFVQSFLRAGIG